MARIKVGVTAHRRHKHILKLAKGYRGAKHLLFRKANETVMKKTRVPSSVDCPYQRGYPC